MKTTDDKLIMEVTLYGKENSYTGEALVDTGSAFVVIPPSVDDQLNLDSDSKQPTIRLTTASGVIEVEKKIIPKIRIGGLTVKDVSAAIHDLPEPVPVKVLVGMSLLLKTRFRLNGKRKKFVIEDP